MNQPITDQKLKDYEANKKKLSSTLLDPNASMESLTEAEKLFFKIRPIMKAEVEVERAHVNMAKALECYQL